MDLAKLRKDLMQCWLAQTLVHVLERAFKGKYVFISMGDVIIAEEGIVLFELMKGFLRQGETVAEANSIVADYYAHVNNLEELQQWTELSGDRERSLNGVLFVVYAPCDDEVAPKHVRGILDATSILEKSWKESLLLVVHNLTVLMGLEGGRRVMNTSQTYYLGHFGAIETSTRTLSDSRRNIKFIAQPLDWLHNQCGWHFVTEIVRWVSESSSSATNNEENFDAARATMFSSINQLPFQLLLLVLRWSHFHPQLVRVCAKKVKETPVPMEELSSSLLVLNASSRTRITSPNLVRLSKCCLWDRQKQFYKDQGISCLDFWRHPLRVKSYTGENRSPNCFVWEAASGSCKFLHSFMLHFTELVETNDEFKSRKLVPLVIATDLSSHVLSSRRQMPCFHPFIERAQLDFALFDTHEFIYGNATVPGTRKTLELLHSRRQWHVGSDGPVVLMGNYFVDSLRADIFTVAVNRDHLSVTKETVSKERVVMQVALLDETTSNIAEMDISLHSIAHSETQTIYEDDRLNATLLQVLDRFQSRCNASVPASVSSTGLIIFPVEAFEFFLTLLDRHREAKAFPIAILAGDARFSFRDAISSAFITTARVKIKTEEESTGRVSLELPQLTPHPDCFCLPVDFEIIEMFFEQLNCNATGISASTKVISTPASDTFDVFFAAIEPHIQESAVAPGQNTSTSITKAQDTSFKHQFANFTPGDCDLLWGMISYEVGARCFSTTTLLAILAQTCWDFDLFKTLHWELLGRLKRQQTNIKSMHYQNILVEAGMKSWRTFYSMEQQTEMDVTMRRTHLQLARWFYELEANDGVLEVLTPWREKTYKDISSDDVVIFYLLGRTSLRMNEPWNALSLFRLCARLAPTKLKFQRQVTRTLLILQSLRHAASCSNAAEPQRDMGFAL
ncbi:unnamed protein product [Peronospora belbahrii]|uniref:RAVE complex protein Rav1 C-terminal domain-containing protein n=1 Tax=Peronospora belbahrii TaxID=622444 RepID=A0AAU9KX45_9STRA|nr:unnamed protein product [Peronospora belbahrii]